MQATEAKVMDAIRLRAGGATVAAVDQALRNAHGAGLAHHWYQAIGRALGPQPDGSLVRAGARTERMQSALERVRATHRHLPWSAVHGGKKRAKTARRARARSG